MRMQWVKYYAPFKRYAWLVVITPNNLHWFKYKNDADKFFKELKI